MSTKYNPDMMANVWPGGTPLPTDEQWDEAERRMRAEAAESYAKGYQGDWGFTLHWTVATYARGVWWHLFFPEDDGPRRTLEAEMNAVVEASA